MVNKPGLAIAVFEEKVAQLQREGWTQQDFARALRDVLEKKQAANPKVELALRLRLLRAYINGEPLKHFDKADALQTLDMIRDALK